MENKPVTNEYKETKHSKSFKSKVALEAIQERETINKIAAWHEIHPNLVTTWKRRLIVVLLDCFDRNRLKKPQDEALRDELYQAQGRKRRSPLDAKGPSSHLSKT